MPRLYSIIISGFKDTSADTLQGVLALQRTADVSFEVIFLDNTPDGRHAAMARAQFAAAPHGLRTVYLPVPTPGKAAAQNLGLAEARGGCLVFLDDDVLPDAKLVLAYDEGFQNHPCGAIQGRVELLFEQGAQPAPWFNARFRLDLAEMDFGRSIMPFEMGLTGANMAIRADLFTRFGLFDERLGPGRSGTLEDQEYSERIRAGGVVQLFWPAASVRHRIPPARLRVSSFTGIYYDVGFSDFFLSGHHIKGGRLRFTLYTLKQMLRGQPRLLGSALCGRTADLIHAYCDCWRAYGYWRQGMRQLGRGVGASGIR
ncbi:MAG: glycosyltransferase family 2 protein [Lentisphaerae bacterium]|nr:glycosyltransferase family 2 protein [Lentisphaerota bacterium]